MSIHDQIKKAEALMPRLTIACGQKDWKELVTLCNTVRMHMEIVRTVANELIEATPAPDPKPAPVRQRIRAERSDKGVVRTELGELIRKQIEHLGVNDNVVLSAPPDIHNMRTFQNAVAHIASRLWGNGSYRTMGDADGREVLIWRGK